MLPGAARVDAVLGDGDAEPEGPSFLFLPLLFESLALESCSLCVS